MCLWYYCTGFISNNDDSYYRNEIFKFTYWCENNNLLLNISETKELIVDLRINITSMASLIINNTTIERITSFKFLGAHVTDDLSLDLNCDILY